MLGYRECLEGHEGEHMARGYDSVRPELTGITSGRTDAAITSGDFAYTPDQLQQIINNWKDLATSYNDSVRDARNMTRVVGPGRDFASHAFAEAANQSGRAYLAYLENNRDYCLQEAQRCQDALDAYLGLEERTIIELNKADGGSSSII